MSDKQEYKTCDICGHDVIYWFKEDYALCRCCWEERIICKVAEKLAKKIVKKFELEEKSTDFIYDAFVASLKKIDDKINL